MLESRQHVARILVVPPASPHPPGRAHAAPASRPVRARTHRRNHYEGCEVGARRRGAGAGAPKHSGPRADLRAQAGAQVERAALAQREHLGGAVADGRRARPPTVRSASALQAEPGAARAGGPQGGERRAGRRPRPARRRGPRRALRPRRAAARGCAARWPRRRGAASAAPPAGCGRTRLRAKAARRWSGSSRQVRPRTAQWAAVSSRLTPSRGRIRCPSRAAIPSRAWRPGEAASRYRTVSTWSEAVWPAATSPPRPSAIRAASA